MSTDDGISAIYAAVDDPEAFDVLPSVMASLAGARSGMLQFFGPEWELRETASSYYSGPMVGRYLDLELWRHDAWKEGTFRDGRERLISLDEAMPVEKFVDTLFYNENFRYWGDDTGRCISGVFRLDDGFATVGLHRAIGAAPFSPSDVAAVQSLVPHYRRMGELRGRLGAVQRRLLVSEGALNSQADGVLVVNQRGDPVLMNAAAREVLAGGEGLILTKIGLRAQRPSESRRLHEAIVSACARSGRQGGALLVSRPAKGPLRVLVSPLGDGHRTQALVVVNDPSRADPRLAAALCAMFGLSPVEAETAAALARGLSPEEVAAMRGVAMPTVRTQVRHILRKMDVRGIAEAAAAVASLPNIRE